MPNSRPKDTFHLDGSYETFHLDGSYETFHLDGSNEIGF